MVNPKFTINMSKAASRILQCYICEVYLEVIEANKSCCVKWNNHLDMYTERKSSDAQLVVKRGVGVGAAPEYDVRESIPYLQLFLMSEDSLSQTQFPGITLTCLGDSNT